MIIVKLSNGNVILKDASGNVLKRLENHSYLQVVSSEAIEVYNNADKITTIYVSEVTGTQIDPAGVISFSGSVYDLMNILTTDFFFVSSGGSVPVTDSFKYIKNNSISFLESNTNITIRTFLLDVIVFYPIHVKQEVDITHAQLQVTTTAGASSRTMVGIYDNGTDGLPKNLITSVEISTTTNSLFSTAFSSPQTLGKGVYWVATCTNISYSAYCLRSGTLGVAQNTFVNVVSSDTGGGLNIYERYRLAYTYNNSLPATITSPLTLTVSDYANPFVTFKIDY
jgi:hypothetical protein